MALTVRDVQGLEAELLKSGAAHMGSVESLLRTSASWFQAEGRLPGVVDRQAFASLCEFARSAGNEDAQKIALGALKAIQHDLLSRPERARFVSRFALRHIVARTGRKLEWAGTPISEADAQDALVLLDVARGDTTYSDESLVVAVLQFVDQFEHSGDMFGRFAEDLTSLVQVLRDPDSNAEHKDIARAAFVYFVEVSDAISDDLGPVGFLDDALVVRHALEQIRPGRAVLSSYLDSAVREWPFLLDVPLEMNGAIHRLSEFMVINSALLFPDPKRSSEGHRGTVLVVGESGPIPFLTGFARALSEVRGYIDDQAAGRFEVEERLADQVSGAEVIFEAYGRVVGTAFEACPADIATHFQIIQPGRRGASDTKRTNSIKNLGALKRSGRKSTRLRLGAVTLDVMAARVGALERTFGSVMPISIPTRRGRVIVVAPLKATKELADSLKLHGTRLTDVLPMSQARVDEEDVVASRWTKDGPGGADLLTVVRSTSEAVELASAPDRVTLAVVGAVRPGSTDAINFKRLASDGVQALSVVAEHDLESQEIFERAGFNFWSWDERWLDQLRWPTDDARPSDHPVAAYEYRRRIECSATVRVLQQDFSALEEANQGLRRLHMLAKGSDDQLLEALLGDGFGSLVYLCRYCVGTLEEAVKPLERFRTGAQGGRGWWSAEIVETVRAVEGALDSAVESLRVANPKQEQLALWASDNPNGAVIARGSARTAAAENSSLKHLTWSTGSGRFNSDAPLLVSAWMGQSAMGRLLVPPVAQNMTLLLYVPEVAWYRSLLWRRRWATDRIRKLVANHSPIPLPATNVATQVTLSQPELDEPIVDQVIDRAWRARVLRRLGITDASDQVEARLVHFVGGHWAPFGADYCVNTVTHLLESGEADESEGLREIRASELRSGDRVVLVRGSDHDALRHAADQELPEHAREDAAEWRAALRRFLGLGHTQAELRRRLAAEGCGRTSATVRSWLTNDRIIGPKDDLTIEAIQKATRDPQLARKLLDCKDAVRLVRSTHFTVAHRLAKRVLERTKEWLGIDTPSEQLVEVEERLVLLTVDSVDPEPAMVPRSALNRLREES